MLRYVAFPHPALRATFPIAGDGEGIVSVVRSS
jgi:hypothetical protein